MRRPRKGTRTWLSSGEAAVCIGLSVDGLRRKVARSAEFAKQVGAGRKSNGYYYFDRDSVERYAAVFKADIERRYGGR